MKALKLINLLALLLSVAWIMSNPDWEPKITSLTLMATLIGLEYGEERKRLKNPDVQLFKKLIQTLPSNGDIDYIRAEEMAGMIDSERLKQIKRFYYEWKDAEHEFLNRGLEKKRKQLYKVISDFLMCYFANAFQQNGTLYRVPVEWQVNDPTKYQSAVDQLNDLADDIYRLHQNLVRSARHKLKVAEE